MRKTIRSLEKEVSALKAERDSHAANWLKNRDRADAAERLRDQIVRDNAVLKERFQGSEMEIARLSGYVERVREVEALGLRGDRTEVNANSLAR